MNTSRTFLAVPVPPAYQLKLYEIGQTMASKGIRWTAPQNLHLTLAFLGNTAPETIQHVGTWLEDFIWTEPSRLQCDYIAPFPDCSSRLLAVYLKRNQELLALRKKIIEQLSALDIAYDKKPFRPHITVGRSSKGANPMAPFPVNLNFQVNSIVLFKSEVNHRGSIYTPLHMCAIHNSGDC